jgi:hypothetical protein
MTRETLEAPQETERASRLAELLACEEDLARLMAETRAEGRRRIEAAQAEAGRAAAELGAALDAEAERARRDIEMRFRARAHAMLEEARAGVTRFQAVSDEEVSRLADRALRLLKEPESRA